MRSTGRMWEYNLIASIKSRRKGTINLQCGAPDFAKLVCNSNTWGFMADLCISNGASKPTHRTGGTSWDFQFPQTSSDISRHFLRWDHHHQLRGVGQLRHSGQEVVDLWGFLGDVFFPDVPRVLGGSQSNVTCVWCTRSYRCYELALFPTTGWWFHALRVQKSM